jgi:hypothetical protein
MATPTPVLSQALASLRSMLEADGYALELSQEGPAALVARIAAGPDACADCLVPKTMMLRYFEDALRPVCDLGLPEITLLYPGE